MNLLIFAKKHRITVAFAIVALGIVSLVIISRIKNPATSQPEPQLPAVSLISVSDYRRQKTINIDNGTVESLGQADLKSQVAAAITAVNVKLGDNVGAGQTLVQLQNADINAQLNQAKAGLAASQSRLSEIQRGARPEDVQMAHTSAQEAQNALVNSIKDSYAKSDDAIHNRIDKFFTNPRQKGAQFSITIVSAANSATFRPYNVDLTILVNNQKYALEGILDNWQKSITNLQTASSTGDIETALALSKKNLQTEIDFLNAMAPLVNDISTNDAAYKQSIDGYKTEFSAARSVVSGTLAALQGAESGWKSAGNALTSILAGSSSQQIAQGQAAVEQAQAALDGLNAALAKTSIVAPISGKISYLSANVGELAFNGQLIATIVNPNALKITAFASESDQPLISAGDPVIINGDIKGTVRTVAPSINPQTKRAQIEIIVNNSPSSIVAGQNVSVGIGAKSLSQTSDTYLLPIQAVQFSETANQNYVFTVDGDNTLQQVLVTTSNLVGENVEVTAGITPDMKILSAVSGFKAGDAVRPQ